ncbi:MULTISPECIES: PspC domain-containing protein [Acinetobacter]|uniref:PspC domain-containing protein n=1 Tax=Acinetobacter pollinis TaxID=2605270 RepID=A0ABU6DS49_9GAMM|nr:MULTISPECIES: PspC domain-containing protein [Acinetobacter]MBF7689753.1 PspC domain-containing protein [Acinetobacter pollinis]MBF7692257.1 PspC domain-containing protein [Acinetobacter pollinis]MBF7697135.1 PspC domain-containing protein [Acinetobacter pollinis]MBF7700186.1 PspC domain-containing protein [Acinetobacter pollinis]MEB5476651.1 PspC domain-containing protein [Acinetobacter pollinis]
MASSGLYRSNKQYIVAGVMGGIAERFGWNANLLRVIFVLVSVISAAFPGILVYLILWLLIPKQKIAIDHQSNHLRNVYEEGKH